MKTNECKITIQRKYTQNLKFLQQSRQADKRLWEKKTADRTSRTHDLWRIPERIIFRYWVERQRSNPRDSDRRSLAGICKRRILECSKGSVLYAESKVQKNRIIPNPVWWVCWEFLQQTKEIVFWILRKRVPVKVPPETGTILLSRKNNQTCR